MLHIKTAKYLSDYVLWLAFDDGSEWQVDLADVLDGPVFLPFKDINFFSKVAVDPELETVVWPNDADLAPEFLKSLQLKQQA